MSHNGIFRGKDLGTISSLNEYIAFRAAHGIDTKKYTDLYLGDYFTVNDGTYNLTWIVADFDYWFFKGIDNASDPDFIVGDRGVVLIPREAVATGAKMNNTATTAGGYVSSNAFTTICPAVAAAMQTVFGSYLKEFPVLVSDIVTSSIEGVVGNFGVSTHSSWKPVKCVIPTQVQICGFTPSSVSPFDSGETTKQLSIFQFIGNSNSHIARKAFWLRDVVSTNHFAYSSNYGYMSYIEANNTILTFCPLIYIG